MVSVFALYSPGLWIVMGIVAGLAGAALTTVTLLALPDGFAPVVTAVATVRGVEESAVSLRQAIVAYHLFGGLLGLVYIVLWPLFYITKPMGIYPTFTDAALVGATLYVIFAMIALPRSDVDRTRWRVVRSQWVLATAVFVLSLSHGYRLLEALV